MFINSCTFLILLKLIFNLVDLTAAITFDEDKSDYIHQEHPSMHVEYDNIMKTMDIYRDFRGYEIPSDVAQTYIPRGVKVGDLFSSNREKNSNSDDDDIEPSFDPWTIVWYVGSFGGLIAFFLVVSCSEWCCLKSRSARINARNGHLASYANSSRVRPLQNDSSHITDTPPPGYHLFAPPSYDSLDYKEKSEKFDIFVVPVHRIATNFTERNVTDNLHNSGVGQESEVTTNNGEPPAYSVIAISPT